MRIPCYLPEPTCIGADNVENNVKNSRGVRVETETNITALLTGFVEKKLNYIHEES